MVKAIISAITNTSQKTYSIAQDTDSWNSQAAESREVRVGDILLSVDGQRVQGMQLDSEQAHRGITPSMSRCLVLGIKPIEGLAKDSIYCTCSDPVRLFWYQISVERLSKPSDIQLPFRETMHKIRPKP